MGVLDKTNREVVKDEVNGSKALKRLSFTVLTKSLTSTASARPPPCTTWSGKLEPVQRPLQNFPFLLNHELIFH